MLPKTPRRFPSFRPRFNRGSSAPHTALFSLLALVLLLGGCVSNRKIVLLQDQEAFKPYESLVDKTWLANPPAFTIRPGDVLMVTVEHSQLVKDIVPQTTLKNMDLYRSIQHPYLIGHTVDKDGNIEVPELGKVNVLGKSIREAEQIVLAKAAEYFSDPVVKVVMLNFAISVVGEVNRPGRYPVYNNEINMLEGLAMANDMTVLADRSRIRVMRSREGANHLYHVDLNDQNVLSNPYFYLQPNDVVIVDPLKRRKFTGRDPGVVISLLTFLVSVVSVYATLNR
ncbi:MAG: polysaccharide biosynthesis/export family protein [Flavobacteriales bacterium]|nr:polysaccharide biosynthesis/export family protein [Flavobacteriales bacterium]